MNEDIEKIIKYFINDAWFTIFNAEECNDEPYKLLNPIEVNEIMDYITKLQNNWNELKKWLEEQKEFLENIPTFTLEITHNHFGMVGAYKNTLGKMQELEQGKDEN